VHLSRPAAGPALVRSPAVKEAGVRVDSMKHKRERIGRKETSAKRAFAEGQPVDFKQKAKKKGSLARGETRGPL